MKKRCRLNTALVVNSLFVMLSASFVTAETSPTMPLHAPKPSKMKMEKQQTADPELMTLLKNWHSSTTQIQKSKGRYLRFVYNTVFKTEERTIGSFHYKSPNKGLILFYPAIIKDQKSKYTGYTLHTDPNRTAWIYDGKSTTRVNVNKKTATQFIPSKTSKESWFKPLFPSFRQMFCLTSFGLAMPPHKMLQRFQVKIKKRVKTTINGQPVTTQIWLELTPKLPNDRAHYQRIQVILDPQKLYVVSAIQLIDPTGNQKTVYSFRNIIVTKKDGKIIPSPPAHPPHSCPTCAAKSKPRTIQEQLDFLKKTYKFHTIK